MKIKEQLKSKARRKLKLRLREISKYPVDCYVGFLIGMYSLKEGWK